VSERVVIIGGDAGGMAAVSQLRKGLPDAEVVALERGHWTSYSACGIPYVVGGVVTGGVERLVARTPEAHRAAGTDVRIGHEAVAIDLDAGEVHVATADAETYRLGYDQLLIATGGTPIRPPLPGIDLPFVHGVQTLDDGADLLCHAEADCQRVVVVGSGYIGLEIAEAFVERGCTATVVERAAQPMRTLDPDMGELVAEAMVAHGIDLRCQVDVVGFEPGVVRTSAGPVEADLVVLGIGVALSGWISSVTGMLIATFVMSVGFHYFETINKSLQLQLLPKAEAPALIGRINSAGAAAQFTTYAALALAGLIGWQVSRSSYDGIFLLIGTLCVVLTAIAFWFFGKFQGPVPQRKELILRQRYWLYYAMTFMSGARRQLFFAFGGFLLVKKFGFTVFDTAKLMLVTSLLNTLLAPQLGKLVKLYGERRSIMFENAVLIAVFAGYALTNDWRVAAALFVIDGVFFTLILAQATYFQKIADPADVASTVSVAFTINHIAAVAIPVSFGLIGQNVNYSIIFWLGCGIASTSFLLSFLVPRHAQPGFETTLGGSARVQPAE
jgi:thioredoxin reductase/predicted MFS family arabinose efflux permease